MNLHQVDAYILGKKDVWRDHPFEKHIAVYKLGPKVSAQMMALIDEKSHPLKISLRCDERLAKVLREKYESVMPGHNLNSRNWNTIVLSGQMSDQEVFDLIEHAYSLTSELLNS